MAADVDDEGDGDEPRPGPNEGQVGELQRFGPAAVKSWPARSAGRAPLVGGDGGALHAAADDAGQPEFAYQPGYRAPRHLPALAAQLPPDLADLVHPEVVGVDPHDLGLQLAVADRRGDPGPALTALRCY